MLITKEIEIDMAHRVPNHKSKCRNLHGHRYKIEVGVDDKKILDAGSSSEGMVIDFSDLKEVMMEELDVKYDHGLVMYERDEFQMIFAELKENHKQKIIFVTFVPTAENLAQWWFIVMKSKLAERGVKIKHVKVWETPTSTATYGE